MVSLHSRIPTALHFESGPAAGKEEEGGGGQTESEVGAGTCQNQVRAPPQKVSNVTVEGGGGRQLEHPL